MRKWIVLALVVVTLTAVLPARTGGAAASETDRTIAKAGLLTIRDFPDGWTKTPHPEGQPSELAACRAIESGVKKNKRYRVRSPDFRPSGITLTQAQNAIYAFPTVEQAAAFMHTYTLPEANECYEQLIRQLHPKQDVSGEALDGSSLPSANLADESVGFMVRLKRAGDTDQQALYFVAIAYRVGRFFDGFVFQQLFAPLPLADSLVEASLARLIAAIPSGSA